LIDIGSYARYAKTGTVGAVTRFDERDGQTFVELDSTGLLYRVDQLTPISKRDDTSSSEMTRDEKIQKVVKDRELIGEEYREAVLQQDGACHGGG
jgi:hypothetical protein